MRRKLAVRRIACVALWLCVYLAPAGAAGLVTLRIGEAELSAEIAATPAERAVGLSGRQQLDNDSGMLFVFERPLRPQFWMRDTGVPLSIAFIDDDNRIVEMFDMKPYSLRLYRPRKPVRYALEMQRGWFRAKRVAVGARVAGLERLPQFAQSLAAPEAP